VDWWEKVASRVVFMRFLLLPSTYCMAKVLGVLLDLFLEALSGLFVRCDRVPVVRTIRMMRLCFCGLVCERPRNLKRSHQSAYMACQCSTIVTCVALSSILVKLVLLCFVSVESWQTRLHAHSYAAARHHLEVALSYEARIIV
jgi:hypothetical protein